MPGTKRPLNDQIRKAMSDAKASQRELARRMSAADGTQWEAKRRWLGKVLSGETVPEQVSLDAIARALGKKEGTFRRPTPEQVRAHRAALEEEVADLRAATAALLSVIQLLCGQVEGLGGTIPADDLEAAVRAVLRTPVEAHGM